MKFVNFSLELNVLNFHSCELRLRALLLELVPAGIRSSCLSTRQTSTIDVLFSCMVDAGPGTGTDKDHTLGEVSRGKAVPVGEVYDELQKWKFACTRLATLGVHAPDPSVQLKTLKMIASRMVDVDQEVKFRYHGYLVARGLSGGVATQGQVDELWRYLSSESREFIGSKRQDESIEARMLAEAKALFAKGDPKGGKGDPTRTTAPKGDPTGARGDPKGGKGDPKGVKGGKNDQKGSPKGGKSQTACKFFDTPDGCPRRTSFLFLHRHVMVPLQINGFFFLNQMGA